MPNPYGFQQYPQRPAPSSRMVGMQLMAAAQGGAEGGTMGGAMMAPGAGEMDPMMGTGDGEYNPAAATVAADEARLRVPMPAQNRGMMDHSVQLRQLGLSPYEITLLQRTGGAR